MKIALITGITGQDGSYLTELLLGKGYNVWGIIRRSSSINTKRIDHVYNNPKLTLRYGDLTDQTNLTSILHEISEHVTDHLEVYNLGAMSHVKVSFEMPEFASNVNGLGTLRLLEALRITKIPCRIYQASTSEMYGKVLEKPQNEDTPFNPQSPYAVSKLYAYWLIKLYRESYNMYACNGILFNHESPRRGETFVTRKITMGIDKILSGKLEYLSLGNLNALRDWSHAKDMVSAMWLMLQQEEPADYVISMNEQHTVREFAELAFQRVGITLEWRHTGLNEIGVDKSNNKVLIRVDPKYFRPSEVDDLLGDSTNARAKLGWVPEYSFNDLVSEMVDCDVNIDKYTVGNKHWRSCSGVV
jgi:GDPmannose 4,6-dehydratase